MAGAARHNATQTRQHARDLLDARRQRLATRLACFAAESRDPCIAPPFGNDQHGSNSCNSRTELVIQAVTSQN